MQLKKPTPRTPCHAPRSQRGFSLVGALAILAMIGLAGWIAAGSNSSGGSPDTLSDANAEAAATAVIHQATEIRNAYARAAFAGYPPDKVVWEQLNASDLNSVAAAGTFTSIINPETAALSLEQGHSSYENVAVRLPAAASPLSKVPGVVPQWVDIGLGVALFYNMPRPGRNLLVGAPFVHPKVCAAINKAITGTSSIPDIDHRLIRDWLPGPLPAALEQGQPLCIRIADPDEVTAWPLVEYGPALLGPTGYVDENTWEYVSVRAQAQYGVLLKVGVEE